MIDRLLSLPILAVAALAVAGCSGTTDVPAASAAQAPATAAGDEPVGSDATDEDTRFNPDEVPVSDAPLGEFPYFSLPAGYTTTPELSSTADMARFPFWVGDRYLEVEGRIYQANIRAEAGKSFSTLEVEQNVEHVIQAAGGVKVAEGEIPRGASAERLTRTFRQEYANGLCWPSEPVRTYFVRRTDANIWIHACTYGGIGAAWVIAETASVEPTASLLPKSRLRQLMDADGRVAVDINFASDSARILEASAPQLEAIAELLEEDAGVHLSVIGHTDDTGTPERNQKLAEGRAEAVVAALLDRGIDAARLASSGRGHNEPVAPNDTAEGRAANRRVELVRVDSPVDTH